MYCMYYWSDILDGKESKKQLQFKENDKVIFLIATVILLGMGNAVLFAVEIFYLFYTQWWILPFGLAGCTIIFFIASAND